MANLVDEERLSALRYEGGEDDPRFLRFQGVLKNLRIIFRSAQAHSRLLEKKSGLSAAQLWMMWEMLNAPGLTVTGLAKALSIHQSTCSNMLDKLQDKGLVFRQRSSTDQRRVKLFLTEKGKDVLAKAPRPAQGALTDVLLRLPDDALVQLETGLDRLVSALNYIDKEAGMIPLSEK